MNIMTYQRILASWFDLELLVSICGIYMWHSNGLNFEMARSSCFQEEKVGLILINMNNMSYHNHLVGYLSLQLHISKYGISYVA